MSQLLLEEEIEVENLIHFLFAQTLYPKFYWKEGKKREVAGVGAALAYNELPHFKDKSIPYLFGGCDFMPQKGKRWSAFPPSFYFLPLIEVRKEGKQTLLRLYSSDKRIPLPIEKEKKPHLDGKLVMRCDQPEYKEWKNSINTILKGISEKKYKKVVLARESSLTIDSPPSPWALVEKLSKSTHAFALEVKAGEAFIGNSPEPLYIREEKRIESHAIA